MTQIQRTTAQNQSLLRTMPHGRKETEHDQVLGLSTNARQPLQNLRSEAAALKYMAWAYSQLKPSRSSRLQASST